MPNQLATRVRFFFAAFMLTLLAYAGVDSALAHGPERETADGCGEAAAPCRLAPLTVTPPAAAAQLTAAV